MKPLMGGDIRSFLDGEADGLGVRHAAVPARDFPALFFDDGQRDLFHVVERALRAAVHGVLVMEHDLDGMFHLPG